MSAEVVTYKRLITYHVQKLREKSTSEGTIRNAESALQRFMKAARRSNNSSLGNEWLDDTNFDSLVARCIKGRPESSKRSFQSLLRAWRESALYLLAARTHEEKDFHDILREAIQGFQATHKLSERQLARRCSISRTSLNRFLRGLSTISDKAITIPLPELEFVLGLTKGTLVRAKERQVLPEKASSVIPYRVALFALRKRPYSFPSPPPLYRVHEEFIALRHFKTAEIVPTGMRRRERWGVRPISDAHTKNPSWSTKLDNTRVCPTADVVWGPIADFLGWAALDLNKGGRGLPVEHLSLAYLTDPELIREHFEFHKARHHGEFSRIFIAFLQNTASLLRSGTGYIRQCPTFAARLLTPIPEAEWDGWCDQSRREIKEMISALEQVSHKRRDPKEPIQAILARQHPLAAIDEMLTNMRRNVPRSQHRRAIFNRNHLLIRLLCVVPLRVRNLASLTYRQDNTGHIRHTAEGWKLEIKGKEFKNYRHAAKNDFSIALPDDLGDELNEYIQHWRPVLLARSSNPDDNILFLEQNGKKFPTLHLSALISSLTKKYCPDTPGFGPHAFRHIVATEYLKNNPNGYQVVAFILHDKLETVLREYGHVPTSDGFAHWTNYLENSALASGGKKAHPTK